MKKIIILIAMFCVFASAKCEVMDNHFNSHTYLCPAMKYEKNTVKRVIISVGSDYINVQKIKYDETSEVELYKEKETEYFMYSKNFVRIIHKISKAEVSLFEIYEILKEEYKI